MNERRYFMTQPREFTALPNPLESCLVDQYPARLSRSSFIQTLLGNNELNCHGTLVSHIPALTVICPM